MNRCLQDMAWPQVQEHLADGRNTVVVALGATEQHGPHLPLATDTLLGDELAGRIAERLDALVAPTLSIGCSSHHAAFPGTLSFTTGTFAVVVGEIVDSLVRAGFQRVILLPSHGGNFAPLGDAIGPIRKRTTTARIEALTDLSALLTVPALGEAEFGITLAEGGLHAGEWETSLLLASDPSRVAMARAEAGFVGDLENALGAIFDHGVHAVSSNGVIGDPRRAEADRGERYWQHIVAAVIERLDGDASA
jgi:creatinine amidohydrolase